MQINFNLPGQVEDESECMRMNLRDDSESLQGVSDMCCNNDMFRILTRKLDICTPFYYQKDDDMVHNDSDYCIPTNERRVIPVVDQDNQVCDSTLFAMDYCCDPRAIMHIENCIHAENDIETQDNFSLVQASCTVRRW